MDANKGVAQAYSPSQIAAILGVHRYTVYKLLQSGRLAGFRISNQWRVTEEELKRFMSANEVTKKG